MQANSELIYKKPGLDDLEHKTEELRAANKQLREINEVMSDKLEVVEQVIHCRFKYWKKNVEFD